MKCPTCGAENSDHAKFCSRCGGALAEPATMSRRVDDEEDTPDGGTWKSHLANTVTATVNGVAGGTGAVELRYGDFFSSVFRHHERDEAERIFMCGTRETTPPLSEVSTRWPRPWLYSRVLLLLVVVTAMFAVLTTVFDSFIGLACLVFFGALTAPLTVTVFFFECNALRNVSFVEVAQIFLLGGSIGLLGSIAIETVIPLDTTSSSGFLAALVIAIVEELVKAAIIAFFLTRLKGRTHILTAMLVGAAVCGAFGTFETAGYALKWWWQFGIEDSMNLILTRSGLAIGCHVAWGAIQGGALGLAADGRDFSIGQVTAPSCLAFLAVTVVLHFLWNYSIPFFSQASSAFGLSSQQAICTAFAWIVISVLLNRGLEQVNRMTGVK